MLCQAEVHRNEMSSTTRKLRDLMIDCRKAKRLLFTGIVVKLSDNVCSTVRQDTHQHRVSYHKIPGNTEERGQEDTETLRNCYFY